MIIKIIVCRGGRREAVAVEPPRVAAYDIDGSGRLHRKRNTIQNIFPLTIRGMLSARAGLMSGITVYPRYRTGSISNCAYGESNAYADQRFIRVHFLRDGVRIFPMADHVRTATLPKILIYLSQYDVLESLSLERNHPFFDPFPNLLDPFLHFIAFFSFWPCRGL